MGLRIKDTHSQMRIAEMSFMIIGIVLFFVLVGIFYLTLTSSGMKEAVIQGEKENSILLVSMLAGSPEFSCADNKYALCVDADKLLVLKNHPIYKRFWGNTGILVKKVYPAVNNTLECSTGNYETCSKITLNEVASAKSPSGAQYIQYSSYVNLCRQDYKNGYHYLKCELGKIIVSTDLVIRA